MNQHFLRPAAITISLAATLLLPNAAMSQDTGDDEIDEIVVTSSKIAVPRRQVGAAISVIDQEDIELRGFASVADVLRTQPGITVSSNGGVGNTTSLRLRGEESFRTLGIIDGVKISDPTRTQVGPSFDHLLTTGNLQRIEMLRGPQGFIYGADAGGVVNILTRTGAGDPGGLVGTEFGPFGTWRLDGTLAGGSENGDFFISGTKMDSDGFSVQEADDVLRDDDGYDNTTLHAKLGWNPADSSRLQLVVRNVDSQAEFDGCGFPTTHDCFSEKQQTTWRLSGDVEAGKFTHSVAYSNMAVDTENFTDGLSSFATDGI